MKTIKYLFIPACFVLLSSCGSGEKANTTVAEEDIAIIDVDVAKTKGVDVTRSYTANVEAYNINNIVPSTPNRILSIRCDVGDQVSKGQVLVTLDATNADQQRINLEQTEREYNRALELLNIGSGTQRAVDQLKAQLDAQRAQYNNTLENTTLISPISGVVTARNYDPGDMVANQPILTIGQISPSVKVMINVNEADLSVIKLGMPVDIKFDAFGDQEFSGKITRISPAVDVATRTFPVEVLVSNPSGKIRPGMFARVNINIGSNESVVVPDLAVVKQSGSAKKFVYVYSNGLVEYREVVLGQRLEDGYELISGVENGDTVVVAGQVRLNDGAKAQLSNKK